MKAKNYSCQKHQEEKLEGKQKFRSKTAAMVNILSNNNNNNSLYKY